MIENNDLGVKVAENKVEAFWAELKSKCEKQIEMSGHDIEINQTIIKLAETKLNESN
jgi:hypothetical protein